MVELTLVLPVHNEAKTITDIVRRARLVLKEMGITYEILCVENGSIDNSLDVATKLSSQFPDFHVLRSKLGWGNAVRKGLAEARGRLFCYMVSDGQVDPKHISALYEYLRKDRVALMKVARTSRENTVRFTVSRVYNAIAASLFGIASADINATPKILETRLARSLKLSQENIGIDLELLLKLKKRALSWSEIPVRSETRKSGSSTTRVKTVWEMVRVMIALLFRTA